MKLDILNDFSLHSAVSEEHTDKYKNYIPPQLMGIWKNYGFGSFYGGYLKIIDPDEWMQVLRDSYFRSGDGYRVWGYYNVGKQCARGDCAVQIRRF